jgi:hypothetical protein
MSSHSLRNLARCRQPGFGLKVPILMASLAMCSIACASMAHRAPGRGPTLQAVDIRSDPAGARILIGKRAVGTTPMAVMLNRRDPAVVRIELDGYEPVEIRLKRTVSGWVALDVAAGLLIAFGPQGFADNPLSRGQRVAIGFGVLGAALAIDFANGAAYTLPKSVTVTLRPKKPPAPAPPPPRLAPEA